MNQTLQKMSPEAELFFNKISACELQKFLTSYDRLGMSENEQKKYVELIDIVAEKIARKITHEETAN